MHISLILGRPAIYTDITGRFRRPAKHTKDLATKRKRNKKLLQTQPRLATVQFLRRWNKILFAYKPKGLQHFVNWESLIDAGIYESILTGVFTQEAHDNLILFGAQPAPESTSLATDQEQLQLTGAGFAFEKLKVTGVHFHDFFHRICHDVEEGQAHAGLMCIFWASLFWMNIGYGPWQSAAWYHLFVASITALSQQLGADDMMLMKFWPRILVDKGLHNEDDDAKIGAPARVKYVEELPRSEVAQFKSVKVKPATWMSWQQAHAKWDPLHNTRAMAITSVCLNKGLIPTSEDLFAGSRGMSLKDCGAQPAPKSKAAAVRNAKAKLDALKKKHQHHIAAAAVLMCDLDCVRGSRLLALGTRASHREFNDGLQALKSPESSAKQCQQWTQWSWLFYLKEAFKSLSDTQELGRCGMTTTFRRAIVADARADSPEVKYEDSLAKTLSRLVYSTVSARIGSNLVWTDQYPNLLFGALDNAVEQKVLTEFKRDVEAWWAAKVRATEHNPASGSIYYAAPSQPQTGRSSGGLDFRSAPFFCS